MRTALALSALALGVAASVHERQYGYGGGGGGYGNAPPPAAAASSSAPAPATTNAPANTAASSTAGLKGDSKCVNLMCISAIVNGSSVTYQLQSTGASPLGWMAMGFGNHMPNTPMVIMWPNDNGAPTISQRMATGYIMPTVDANPPRVAAINTAMTSLTGNTPTLAYTIPANSDTVQDVIWAFASAKPSGSAVDAELVQHLDSASFQLDLTKDLASNPPSTPPPSSGSGGGIPLQPYQKVIVAHAILCIIGFLLLLPAGALYARLLRTITVKWFKAHWIFQWGLAGPVITVGWILGIVSVVMANAPHVNDTHKRLGITLGVLYAAQCSLGAFIHFIKDPNRKRRPAQNYVHAVFGLTIIGLAFYQVYIGYNNEWPKTTGREKIGNGANIVFYIWVVLLPVLYFGGLALLPRQFRQERRGKSNQHMDDDEDMRRRM